MLNTEKEEKSVWDSLVDAFLEDMKQFPIDQCLYAFVTAYNITMQEQEVEESDKEYYDYVNAKTNLIWEEIDNLKEEYNDSGRRIELLWNEFNRLKARLNDLDKQKVYQPKVPTDWTPATLYKCTVCGVGSAHPMGYVCQRSDCPSSVTSSGVSSKTATLTGDVSKTKLNNTGAVTGTIRNDILF
jgi:hypothetical protein